MRYWVDFPLEQWIYIRKEKLHNHPYAVYIGEYIRARFTYKSEAEELVKRIKAAFKK